MRGARRGRWSSGRSGGGGGGSDGALPADAVPYSRVEAGPRCTLTPPDPQLKGARYPRWFQPVHLSSEKIGFKTCLSKCNFLHCYVEAALAHVGPHALPDPEAEWRQRCW
jgi:hypothetical protein